MISPDFDPLAMLNQCQMDLLRQNRIITNVIKQNENISELMIQHTEAFAQLQHKFNQLIKEHKELQIKLALRCD